MWEETLAKELPSDDRHENPIPNIVLREAYSLHATYTIYTTSMPLYGSNNFAIRPPPATSSSRASSKRSVSESLGRDIPPGPSNSTLRKRHRQEGQHDVEHDNVTPSEVSDTPGDIPDGSPTRGGKLQRTDSQVIMPPPPPSPSLRSTRSTSTKGKNTRRSTKQTGGSSATAPVSEYTATTARRNGRKR